jgi:uncharacterized phage-like protein YoqJ
MTADNKAHKPELVIGITGHRYVVETKEVLQQIDFILEKIFHTYPDRKWRVLSPLAEGADRILVKRIQEFANANTKFSVILPLSLDEYQKDFSAPASKQEFLQLLNQADDVIQLSPSKNRDEAYAKAGQFILEHCDVLVAIWDGKPEKGSGGTGEIVRCGRDRGLPLAWIKYQEPRLTKHPFINLGKHQDRIVFEHFPPHES